MEKMMAKETNRAVTGGQIVVDHLVREGVTHAFGIPGHGNTALMDAFVDLVPNAAIP